MDIFTTTHTHEWDGIVAKKLSVIFTPTAPCDRKPLINMKYFFGTAFAYCYAADQSYGEI